MYANPRHYLQRQFLEFIETIRRIFGMFGQWEDRPCHHIFSEDFEPSVTFQGEVFIYGKGQRKS